MNTTARKLLCPRAQKEIYPEIKSQVANRDRAELLGKHCQVKIKAGSLLNTEYLSYSALEFPSAKHTTNSMYLAVLSGRDSRF